MEEQGEEEEGNDDRDDDAEDEEEADEDGEVVACAQKLVDDIHCECVSRQRGALHLNFFLCSLAPGEASLSARAVHAISALTIVFFHFA